MTARRDLDELERPGSRAAPTAAPCCRRSRPRGLVRLAARAGRGREEPRWPRRRRTRARERVAVPRLLDDRLPRGPGAAGARRRGRRCITNSLQILELVGDPPDAGHRPRRRRRGAATADPLVRRAVRRPHDRSATWSTGSSSASRASRRAGALDRPRRARVRGQARDDRPGARERSCWSTSRSSRQHGLQRRGPGRPRRQVLAHGVSDEQAAALRAPAGRRRGRRRAQRGRRERRRDPDRRAARRHKSYGAVQALRDGSIALRAGRGARARRRERRRQVDGGEGARRRRAPRRGRDADRRRAGRPPRPHDARDAGIAVIYQEPTLFPDLSVAENVVMGRHRSARCADRPARGAPGGRRGCSTASACASTPSRPVRGLSIADQQIVEIAKALSFDARVLIMDEPTAALSGAEVERLFGVVRTLRDRGAAVLFISHRLEEVFAICETVTIMRDGQVVHDARRPSMTPTRSCAAWSAGTSALFPKEETEIGAPVLRVAPAHPRRRLHRRQLRGPRGRDRRARRARRAPGAARSPRAIFGIDRADGGPRRGRRRAAARGEPTAAMRAASASCPRTAASRGS